MNLPSVFQSFCLLYHNLTYWNSVVFFKIYCWHWSCFQTDNHFESHGIHNIIYIPLFITMFSYPTFIVTMMLFIFPTSIQPCSHATPHMYHIMDSHIMTPFNKPFKIEYHITHKFSRWWVKNIMKSWSKSNITYTDALAPSITKLSQILFKYIKYTLSHKSIL